MLLLAVLFATTVSAGNAGEPDIAWFRMLNDDGVSTRPGRLAVDPSTGDVFQVGTAYVRRGRDQLVRADMFVGR